MEPEEMASMLNFNIISALILMSVSQGFFLTIFIFHKYGKSLANKLLGWLLLCYSIAMVNVLFGELSFHLYLPHFVVPLSGIAVVIAPLHYLYVKYLTHYHEKFERNELLHFIPFLIYELALLPSLLKPAGELAASFSNTEAHTMPLAYMLLNWALTVQTLIYVFFSLKLINSYSVGIKLLFSSIEKIRLDWLKIITILYSAAMLIFMIENMLFFFGMPLSEDFNFSSSFGAIFIYVLGYMGLLRSEVFSSTGFTSAISELPSIEAEEAVQKKYEKSGLSLAKAREYTDKLLKEMLEHEHYKDSELTLNKLAEAVAISSHNLSEILNTQIKQSFFDFVNSYRVEKVKLDLLDSSKGHYTMLAIALEAGFNSKSSFNSTFKKFTGLTPSEFRKKNSDQLH